MTRSRSTTIIASSTLAVNEFYFTTGTCKQKSSRRGQERKKLCDTSQSVGALCSSSLVHHRHSVPMNGLRRVYTFMQ